MNKQKSFDKLMTMGRLYLVPTPIGNLQDMTFRAVTILKEVKLIASEDTRNTQKLLNHFEIKTPQISFHEHNVQTRIPDLIERLTGGEDIAQVSDAGMPSISDPGHELVVSCLAAGIAVIALPGATAGVTALIASGLDAAKFSFYGFLARKKNEQVKELMLLVKEPRTLIFYESPHRVKPTFANLAEVFGPTRQAVLCRELTKVHEEYLRGTLSEIADYLKENEVKGECCVLVAGYETELPIEQEPTWSKMSVIEHVEQCMSDETYSSKEAIKAIAKIRGLKKQDVYKAYHHEQEIED